LSFPPDEPIFPEDAADPAPERLFAEAKKRLRAALDGLDHALSRLKELELEQADQVAEFSALQEDRSRLAQELDAAAGRARLLESANIEAARRIERASAAVRSVIAADLAGGPGDNLPGDDLPGDNLSRED
jgi:hypothetical protein